MIDVERFIQVIRKNPTTKSGEDIIISTDKKDITKPLLAAAALFEDNTKEYVVKFVFRNNDIGLVDKKTVVKFIFDSFGFDPAGNE